MAAVPSPQRSLQELLARAGEMPVMPHVVFRLMEASGQDSQLHDFERFVQMDPGFAVRVLRRANGSGSIASQILSLHEAIKAIGATAVIDIATASGACFDAFIGKNDPVSLRKRTWWRQSIDTAKCCSIVAGKTGMIFPDEAFTVGLLHGIGKTLLNRLDSERYDRVESLLLEGVGVREAEAQVYGWDHQQVGEAAAENWGLPMILCKSLQYDAPTDDPAFAQMRSCLSLGLLVAHHAISGSTGEGPHEWALEALGLDREGFLAVCEAGSQAISQPE